MASPANIFNNVATYQKSGLAYFQNYVGALKMANTKFKDFQNITGNLGDTITFDIDPDSAGSVGLIASFMQSAQKKHSLTCDWAFNVGRGFTNQELTLNLDATDYLDRFGKADVAELGSFIEANILRNFDSSVPVMIQDPNNKSATIPNGQLHTESGPSRFYGDGVTPINTYQQIAQMVTNFKNVGVLPNVKVVLPDTIIPAIIGNGLNQFVPSRNDETAQSWELGNFNGVEYIKSNLLPIHISGAIGNQVAGSAQQQLTVVSTNDPTGNNVTQITFSSTLTTLSNAVLSGDLAQCLDTVGFQPVRFLTKRGHVVSASPLQIRAINNADTNGSGLITINLDANQALVWAPGPAQNLSTPIVPGMKFQMTPSHKVGGIVGGNALFVAMPQLPDESPFPTAYKADSDTGIAIRMYQGSLFGQNLRGMVTDAIWGSTLVPIYSMRILFPLAQAA
jgi:hypothetical protein